MTTINFQKAATLHSKRLRDRAKDFEKWLNSAGKAQGIFRPLVELTAALTKHELQRKRRRDTLDPSDPYLSQERKINRILTRIRKQYPSHPQLVDWGDKHGLPLFAEQPVGSASREAWEACSALQDFDLLANAGAFAGFELCALPACGRYFFAFPRQKRYCSDAHQRAHYDQSPDRKQKNADYQREHYRDFLSVAAKQKELRRGRSRSARRAS